MVCACAQTSLALMEGPRPSLLLGRGSSAPVHSKIKVRSSSVKLGHQKFSFLLLSLNNRYVALMHALVIFLPLDVIFAILHWVV